MKKVYVLFIVLLLSCSAFAQIEKEFAKILATRDFRKVQPFCDNLPQSNYPKRGETINSCWVYLRDLAPGFKEGVFSLTHYARNSERHIFKMNILVSADTQIACYSFNHFVLRDKTQGGNMYDTLFKYSNDTLLNNLADAFKNTFGSTLAQKDLFLIQYRMVTHADVQE